MSQDLIFVVAGEPSGDALGGRLMAALRAAAGEGVRFAGVGGERMAAQGLASLFPIEDIAVIGITEILPRLPRILRRIEETAAAIKAQRPAVVVTIDSPAFSHRVADKVRGLGIPIVHYVAPQLWAWRPGRARKFARRFDHMLVLLPFEPEFFANMGLSCTYVGHPVLEQAEEARSGDFRARHGIPADAPLVAALPGSRAGLVQRMLPLFTPALAQLRERVPGLRVVVPTVPATDAAVRAAATAWRFPYEIVSDPVAKPAALAAATAALTVSGTATMELAVAGTPMVVTYRVNALTAFLARRLVRVPDVAMPNLILRRRFVPELLQDQATPEALAASVALLLQDGEARAAQRAGLAEVCRILGRDELHRPEMRPSARAARAVLDVIRARREAAA